MNTSILRKVVMLVVLFAGYVSVMGGHCADHVYEPCKAVPNSPVTYCAITEGSSSLDGYCSAEVCRPGSPEDPVNKCAGSSEGAPCKVSDELTGTCVNIAKALRCVVIVDLSAAMKDGAGETVVLNPCEGIPDGTVCTTAEGQTGDCEANTCKESGS